MAAFFEDSPGEGHGGIAFTHGKDWEEQRRFALKTLREIGYTSSSMEDLILFEVEKLVRFFAPYFSLFTFFC